MRRLFFVAVGMLFLFAALLPTRSSFVAGAVSDGERLAMFSKPSVVRIIDGVAGTFYFAPPNSSQRTTPCPISAWARAFSSTQAATS